MKFSHIADCHIGSWRDPKLRDSSIEAFVKAIDSSINQNVDFILISGDLFNTSLPSMDHLKTAVEKLKELKDKKVPVYLIAGSHDFSPSGKTMLEVLEKAGLFINVSKGEAVDNKLKLKFTIDEKTGTKITGLLGKKGGLEKEYYESLDKENLENETGYKIFMFHSALTEFKPESLKDMDSSPLSLLPKNFNYYAGGHVHYIFEKDEKNYGKIVFPGPIFPNNFKELEDLEMGGMYIVEVENNVTKTTYEPIQIHKVFKINIDANNKTPAQVQEEINKSVEGKELNDTIVTLRIKGTLLSGKVSDIHFKEIFENMYNKSAYFVMKNTAKLHTKEFEEIKIEKGSVDDVEQRLIKEHLGQIKVTNMNAEKEESLVKSLLSTLSIQKEEGETISTYEKRLKSEIDELIKIN